jgi:large subunit ribosomal protein L19
MDVSSLVEIKKNTKIPDIAPGDTVRVSARIVEGGKERIQVFQGVVIKIRHGGNGASFTVRHVAYGVGVERTFPFGSPLVEKVEIVRQGKVRRSRLYYLRGLSGKEARRKIKRVERKVREQVGEELLAAPPEEEYVEPAPAGETVAEEKAAVVAPEPATATEAPPETAPVAEAPAEAEAAPAPGPEAAQEETPEAATPVPEAPGPALEKDEATETPAEAVEGEDKEAPSA